MIREERIEVIASDAVPEGEMYFIAPRRRNEPLKEWARRCLHVTGIASLPAMSPADPEAVGGMMQLAMAVAHDEADWPPKENSDG